MEVVKLVVCSLCCCCLLVCFPKSAVALLQCHVYAEIDWIFMMKGIVYSGGLQDHLPNIC